MTDKVDDLEDTNVSLVALANEKKPDEFNTEFEKRLMANVYDAIENKKESMYNTGIGEKE